MSDQSWWSLVVASSSDSEGEKTSLLILVPKTCSAVSYSNSISIVDDIFISVLKFEFELVVRIGDGIGSVYSLSISSSSDMDKMKSSSLDFFSTSMKAIISLCSF